MRTDSFDLLDAIRLLRIVVIGEAITDVYHFVTPIGVSQKDAIVTWRQGREESYEGGATACANHLRQFCDNVGEITQEVPLVKRRFVWTPFVHKVFAVESLELEASERGPCSAVLAADLRNYDAVVVADYGHGLLNADAIQKITKEARFLAVMVQTNSANFGFNLATRWPRADYVCLDEMELRLAMQDRETEPVFLAEKLRERMDAKMVAVTLGHLGCVVVDAFFCDWMKAASDHVVDRIGAGDAFFSITAPCVALGATRSQIGRIGNAAGAIAVRTMGNKAPVTRAELETML